jgi:hypothetical protein
VPRCWSSLRARITHVLKSRVIVMNIEVLATVCVLSPLEYLSNFLEQSRSVASVVSHQTTTCIECHVLVPAFTPAAGPRIQKHLVVVQIVHLIRGLDKTPARLYMESLRVHVECAADSPQQVGKQFIISLQNPPGAGIPQAVLNSPLEGQNRYESWTFLSRAN